MQAVLTRCPVCGHPSEGAICERCNTIITWEEAACPICGRMYPGQLAVCKNCEDWLASDELRGDDDELRSLTSVAGLSKETARVLFDQGFRDFSDLVKLALPPMAVRIGLHKTIARRMMMAEYIDKGKKVEDGRCPICFGEFDPETGMCKGCRYTPLPEWSGRWIEKRLEKVTGEVENLCSDPDFLAMPETERKNMLSEINGMLEPVFDEERLVHELEEVFGEEPDEDPDVRRYKTQIEAWRSKGFDVITLKEMLDRDIEEFKTNCVKVIRGQMKKRERDSKSTCPLCKAFVEAGSRECRNCGAKFGDGQT